MPSRLDFRRFSIRVCFTRRLGARSGGTPAESVGLSASHDSGLGARPGCAHAESVGLPASHGFRFGCTLRLCSCKNKLKSSGKHRPPPALRAGAARATLREREPWQPIWVVGMSALPKGTASRSSTTQNNRGKTTHTATFRLGYTRSDKVRSASYILTIMFRSRLGPNAGSPFLATTRPPCKG